MKKTLCIVVAGLILAGCSQPHAKVQPKPAETSVNVVDTTFLTSARSIDPELNSISDATLIGAAKGTCRMLESGESVDQVFNYLTSEVGAGDAGILIGGAGVAYCPDQQDRINTWKESQ